MARNARPVGLSIRLTATQRAERRRDAGDPVPGLRAARRASRTDQPRHRHAVRAAGPARLVGEHHRDEQAQAERRDRQIVALQPQDRPPDHEGEQRRQTHAAEQRRPGRHAEMRRPDRDRIGADAEEAGMAEADLAGEAHQQVEAEHRERVDEDQRCDAQIESATAANQRQRPPRWRRRRITQRIGARDEAPHDHTRSTLRWPNRPCGMANRTARMTRKATASL